MFNVSSGSSDSVNELPRVNTYFHQDQSQQYSPRARSLLEHYSLLDIDRDNAFVRQTTLVCTLGKSWSSEEKLEEMIDSGMNILRLNMAMKFEMDYAKVIKCVREIEKRRNYSHVVGIALDFSAPLVRTGLINGNFDATVKLKTGDTVKVTIDQDMKDKTSENMVYLDIKYFPTMLHCFSTGDRLYLDDGTISLIIKSISANGMTCLVEQGGELGSCKRVYVPCVRANNKTFAQQYVNELKFAVEQKVDYVFTSYTTNVNQVAEAKRIVGDDIMLLACVQSSAALATLDEIMAIADGIIIGRCSLGLCYSTEKVFALQKQIIAKCNIVKKPVFIISQLLESMCYNPKASRAEISDVANAVLDGADGLILTTETSSGLYPREALKVLHKTTREAESAVFHEKFWLDMKTAREMRGLTTLEPLHLSALAAFEASSSCNASAIFVMTTSGQSAIEIASYRPFCPVIAITRSPQVAHKCHLFRGIHPFVYTGERMTEWSKDMDLRFNAAINHSRSRGFIKGDDHIIIVTGVTPGSGSTNTVRILKVPTTGKSLKIIDSKPSCIDQSS